MPYKTIKYRHVREGHGGTLSVHALTPAIGTRKCLSCVGVYFPVSDQKCFVAHINSCLMPSDYLEHADTYLLPRVCENVEGERIQNIVDDKLKQAARDGGWTEASVDRSKVIVVCSKYDSQPTVSKFVVEAIRSFLKMGNDLVVHAECHGFVADPTAAEALLLPEESFLGGLDMDGEAKNGIWEQNVRGVILRFEAGDIPETTSGLQRWSIILRDGVVPMAERQGLIRRVADSR
ncbi:hypothetical protein DOTSEDRAFT_31378 [Dothistroma septosporum NZE10]|uniref:Uncharacterized protein n=1 Tax=Dothistroma septosporum (strain NZE10 / CBS 128990) TaxID=675120 RepID=N1Q5G4_DOTSN|nr:hypothetical protein DOTSEDRAFT_31378 [Dothistroma septosporum NZE10]